MSGRTRRSHFELLLEHAGDLDVEVEWADLGSDRGDYDDATKVIRLNHCAGLIECQLADTLSHEIGHAIFGDTSTAPSIERRASEMGASLLIEPSEYAAAEEMVGTHAGALGIELGVTRDVVLAWRRWCKKRYPIERLRLDRLDLDSGDIDDAGSRVGLDDDAVYD